MRIQTGLMFILMLCVFPGQANATIYGWQEDGGVLNLSNDPEEVPDTETAQKYTTRFLKKSAKKDTKAADKTESTETTATAPITDPATAEVERLRAYERGLEQGLATAERQVQMAGELARTVLSAIPPAPPVQPRAPVHIVVQQAAPVVRHSSPGQNSPFYGFIGPYTPHSYFGGHGGYSYGFRQGRFPRHSHFYPGRRGGRRGLFFPRGHFSRDGFLFGHGIVLR
jgi:hypothetical protein